MKIPRFRSIHALPRPLKGILFVLAVGLLLVELVCCVFFNALSERFTFYDLDSYVINSEQIKGVAKRFDPLLGWSQGYDTPFGERPGSERYPRHLIASFGDSFTHCDQVQDNQTWQVELEKLVGANVFNFGVGAFGPDQALLRFRRDYPLVRTPVVTLGLITENINRVIGRYRPFYSPKTRIPLPKPRFNYNKNSQELVLVPSPITHVSQLSKLMNPSYLLKLGNGDWWFENKRHPTLTFPFSRLLFSRTIWSDAIASVQGSPPSDLNPRPRDSQWQNEESRTLMFAILQTFHREVLERGALPIVLLMPKHYEVNRCVSQQDNPEVNQILAFCRRSKMLCFDGIAALCSRAENLDQVKEFYRGTCPHWEMRSSRIPFINFC